MARYLFITGKLAAQSLRATLEKLPTQFEYEIAILPISVAALMDAGFINKHLAEANGCNLIYVPGLCKGDLLPIAHRLGVEVLRGPKSLKDLPSYFGAATGQAEYGAYRTKIIAEIVDAHQLSLEEILSRAAYYRASGADIIDLGCPVAAGFPDIGRTVSALKNSGYLVSVDSFNPQDILNADAAGVDFVLSVNSQNLQIARRLHGKVVVIPDFDNGIESLEKNLRQLEDWGIPSIIDPILNPICFGFTRSVEGFIDMRRKYPNAEMLLGLGNLTELTAADTTGITAVMAGIVAELGIEYVLTTEVISWARGAVREFDIARRLMHYACRNQVLPKHLDDSLITVKDPPFEDYGEEELRAMQAKVRDRNFRIFTDRNSIYVFNNRLFIRDADIGTIFDQLKIEEPTQAFYLGRELQKASMAVRLGKKYVQEEELKWGYLSRERGSRDS